MKHSVSVVILLGFFFLGCSSKTTVVLLDSGKPNNAILVANEKGVTKLDKIGNYVELTAKSEAVSKIKNMSKSEIEKKFSKALASSPLAPISYILYFKPNSKELTDDSKKELQLALKTIKERSLSMVDVIGHTDTIGSNEVNLKVSLERAKYIKSKIKQTKVKVVSLIAKGHGEEDLQVKTQNNKAEAKNRNVEIFIK